MKRKIQEELVRLRSSRMAKNAAWMFAGQGMSFVLQAGYFVLLARLLGPSEYGIFAGAFALVAIAGNYSTLGAGTLFLRYVSSDPKKFSIYWGNILLVTSSVSIFIMLLLYFAAPHLIDPRSAAIVGWVAIANCFCNQLSVCSGQVFQAFDKLRVTATLNLLTSFSRLLAAGSMVLFLHRATAMQWAVASLAVSLLAAAIATVSVTVAFGLPRFKPRLFLDSAAEGFGYSFAMSTTSAYNDIDKTMLSHYGMNAANGIYTMAYRVVDIATMPIFSIRDAAMPRFFREGAEGIDKPAQLAKRLLTRALLLGCVAAAVMFVTAPLIPLVVGAGFKESVSALRWLCLIPVFRSVHQMTGAAITGVGMQRYRTVSQILAAGLNFGSNLWLIPRYGWLGAAWASLLTDASLGAMNWTVLRIVVRMKGGKSAHLERAG